MAIGGFPYRAIGAAVLTAMLGGAGPAHAEAPATIGATGVHSRKSSDRSGPGMTGTQTRAPCPASRWAAIAGRQSISVRIGI